jgi:TPR repeat protein
MLATGRGVARNDSEAAAWLRQAADQGLAKAQFLLALFYRDGRGTSKDDVQAYKWLLLSGALTPEDARWTIAAALLELGEAMSPDAIDEARRQAREWAAAFDARHEQPD